MQAQVISFNCLLKNKAGHLISSTFNREVLTSVDDPNVMLHGLAKGLQNVKKGEKRSIALSAEEAYGLYDPKKVISFPRENFPEILRMNQTVSIVGTGGSIQTYRVAEIHNDLVSLDGNHPLAGQDLIFEIETLEARDATPEEIQESSNIVSSQLLH